MVGSQALTEALPGVFTPKFQVKGLAILCFSTPGVSGRNEQNPRKRFCLLSLV